MEKQKLDELRRRAKERLDSEHDDFPGLDSIPENLEVLNDREAKFVRVSIQDQGVGIPWEVLTQVFDPYFTSKNLWNKKGLGLGLTVTYSILKKHGGAIDIASRPDAGTTVSMYLPAIDRQIIDTQESRPRKGTSRKKNSVHGR